VKRKKPSQQNYEIGYRKPPKATRFQPGQSGNPCGRSQRSKNGKTLLKQALDEIVVVSEGGVTRRMTKREAFFKQLVARALKDNRFAALLIKTMEQYDVMLPEQANRIEIVFVKPDGTRRSSEPE
jgi:hypothetical protein